MNPLRPAYLMIGLAVGSVGQMSAAEFYVPRDSRGCYCPIRDPRCPIRVAEAPVDRLTMLQVLVYLTTLTSILMMMRVFGTPARKEARA